MAYRKSRLKINYQDLAVNTDIRTQKLDEAPLESAPDIINRDKKSGQLVIRQVYDKASGDPLEEGYGYRWVTEDGDEVPTEDIQYFQVVDGEEQEFSLYEPTLGGGRTVTPENWIPVDQIGHYLIDRTYEIWGEDDIDVVQLNELADFILEADEAPVIPTIMQQSKYKSWGVITPYFYDDEFAMILRITRQKIEPEHYMPVMDEDTLKEKRAEAEKETPKLEQDSPFN